LRHLDFSKSGRSRSLIRRSACTGNGGIDGRSFPKTAEEQTFDACPSDRLISQAATQWQLFCSAEKKALGCVEVRRQL
ncbi:MAG: hypothetical protein WA117_16030, partial [Verrucomicrobiia bacterium]